MSSVCHLLIFAGVLPADRLGDGNAQQAPAAAQPPHELTGAKPAAAKSGAASGEGPRGEAGGGAGATAWQLMGGHAWRCAPLCRVPLLHHKMMSLSSHEIPRRRVTGVRLCLNGGRDSIRCRVSKF